MDNAVAGGGGRVRRRAAARRWPIVGAAGALRVGRATRLAHVVRDGVRRGGARRRWSTPVVFALLDAAGQKRIVGARLSMASRCVITPSQRDGPARARARRLGVAARRRRSSSVVASSLLARLWYLQVVRGRRACARSPRTTASAWSACAPTRGADLRPQRRRSWSTTGRRSTSCSCPRTRTIVAGDDRDASAQLPRHEDERRSPGAAARRRASGRRSRTIVLRRDLDWERRRRARDAPARAARRLAAGRAAPHLSLRRRWRRICSATSAR